MKLFVGLGNPGAKYARHRHNVGYMAVDRIAGRSDAGPWRRRFQGETAEARFGPERVVLLKPTTYMNDSGQSVGEAMRFLKIEDADVYVFHDEIDLAPGKLKVKAGGGNAGHNGLRSLSAHIGNDYNRVRIGVGHPGVKEAVAHYVLHDFAKAEHEWLEPMLDAIAAEAAFLAKGDSARFLTNVAQLLSKAEPALATQPTKGANTQVGLSKKYKDRNTQTRRLDAARFNLYTMGARNSAARIYAREISYWSDRTEMALGMIFEDRADKDFGWILFLRDRVGRFRAADVGINFIDESKATNSLRRRIERAVATNEAHTNNEQGDEPNAPFDLLQTEAGLSAKKLHPFFALLLTDAGHAPARAAIKEIGPWLTPTDPHFVHEFQSNQFDQRIWELYLWAAFRELGFDIDQPEAPDFLCRAPGIEFTVEATTVAPSSGGALAPHPDPQTPDEMREFLTNYMPMKFGSSLTSKLNKKNSAGENYWERGETTGKPFILAIADFHKPGTTEEIGSMSYTQSALLPYLYGHRFEWQTVDGRLVTRALKNTDHTYKGKSIPSGFFDLPGAENVSAVLFSNAGTLAKFTRMGVAAGFGAANYTYLRMGFRINPDPDAAQPVVFSVNISDESYREFWSEELQIFHNPGAKIPLPRGLFSGITQHFFIDGKLLSYSPESAILSSITQIIGISDSNNKAIGDRDKGRPTGERGAKRASALAENLKKWLAGRTSKG